MRHRRTRSQSRSDRRANRHGGQKPNGKTSSSHQKSGQTQNNGSLLFYNGQSSQSYRDFRVGNGLHVNLSIIRGWFGRRRQSGSYHSYGGRNWNYGLNRLTRNSRNYLTPTSGPNRPASRRSTTNCERPSPSS